MPAWRATLCSRRSWRGRTDRRAYDPARGLAAADAERLRAAVGTLPVRFGLAGRADAPTGDAARLAALRAVARDAWRHRDDDRGADDGVDASAACGQQRDRSPPRRHRDHPPLRGGDEQRPACSTATGSRTPVPQVTAGQIKDFDEITASTPAYLWIVTEGNRRMQQIDAGRAYVRVNLAGAAARAGHASQMSRLCRNTRQSPAPYQAIYALLDAPAP